MIVPLAGSSYDGQRLMRHRDKRSTDNYYHAWNEGLLDIVQRMDNDNVVELKETRKRKRKGNES
jgi:integrase